MPGRPFPRRGFLQTVTGAAGAAWWGVPVRAKAGRESRQTGERSMVGYASPWTSPFRVDPQYPHHLVNREGRHLFILNKTAWAYFGCRNPQGVVDRARAQGMTVLRVALEGAPYPEALGIDLWPWGGTRRNPDWSSFRAAYWDEVARRIRLAGDAGLGFNVTLYFTLHPGEADTDRQRPYWDQVISRLGRYANVLTWELANEYVGNERFQDAAGSYFKSHDPAGRPVITSNGTTDDAIWPRKAWMDMAVVHTCTGSAPPFDLRDWYQHVARNTRAYGKPSFNNESGRERRHGNDDPVHRRKQGWIWSTSGGYWTWHSWEGCEGIDDASYRGPGEQYNRPMSDFFQSIPFWQLSPNLTALEADDPDVVVMTLASEDRRLVVAYLCTRVSGRTVDRLPVQVRLPEGPYRVVLSRPDTLQELAPLRVQGRGVTSPAGMTMPTFTDDVIVRIDAA